VAGLRLITTLIVACGVLWLPGCGSDSAKKAPTNALGDNAITVGSFDFPESEVLANLYGQALRKGGYQVRLALNLGPRELVEPALARGLLELVPEYAGSAVQYLGKGAVGPSPNPAGNYQTLTRLLRREPLVALAFAPAQDANAVVVTNATAVRYHLRSISDLTPIAPRLMFAGPPECPDRPLCLKGLKRTYRVDPKRSFQPLETGKSLTRRALVDRLVDVGVLFSTDPSIAIDGCTQEPDPDPRRRRDLVALCDNLHLQPAENVTPLLHREVEKRWGPAVGAIINDVSRRLTQDELRGLNREVEHRSASAVARRWLSDQGIT
jgi:osmoprotectant transport system substrate-binding protein